MKKKWMVFAMSALISAGVLSACNGANDGGEEQPQEQPEDVNYVPTERQDVERDAFDTNRQNQDNRRNQPEIFDMEGESYEGTPGQR